MTDFDTFRDAGAGTSASGYVVIDRSMAREELNAFYASLGFKGAGDAIISGVLPSPEEPSDPNVVDPSPDTPSIPSDETPSISISIDNFSSITQGSRYSISGTITSKAGPIKEVTGRIRNHYGVIVQPDAYFRVNTTNSRIDFRDTTINQQLAFEKLTPGLYTLEIQAVNDIGKRKAIVRFMVKPNSSSAPVISLNPIPSAICGAGIDLKGFIVSFTNLNPVLCAVIPVTKGTSSTPSFSFNPNGNVLDLKDSSFSTKLNSIIAPLAAGAYTLQITATNAVGTVTKEVAFSITSDSTPDTPSSTSEKPVITLESIGSVPYGKPHDIVGTVTSETILTSVKGEIIGTTQRCEINPYTTSLNLKNSAINANLKFAGLDPGKYTLKITATNSAGTTEKSVSFTVAAPAKPTISLNAIGTVAYGSPHDIVGTVTSETILTSVKGEIIGTTQRCEISPYSTSLDLKNSAINANLKFAGLDPGKYTLKITATNSAGTTEKSVSFTVAAPAKPTISLNAIGTVAYGSPHDIVGTVTSETILTSVKGEIIGTTQRCEISPYSTSLDLKNSAINANLKFAGLDPGNYTLKITAVNSGGTTTKSVSFTVSAPVKKFTIDFKPNAKGEQSGSMPNQQVVCGSSATINKVNYTRPDYAFTGWNTKSDGTGTAYKDQAPAGKITSKNGATVVLYAQWAPVFTIDFKPNAGGKQSGSMSNQKVTYGSSTKINKNNYSRPCYTFSGWNTKSDGTGTAYKDQAAAGKITNQKGAIVKLYAQWKLSGHTLPSSKWTCAGSGANHYKRCTKCGETITKAHTYPQSYQSTSSYHYRVCTGCGYQCNENHKWVYAGSGRQCKICKRDYGH